MNSAASQGVGSVGSTPSALTGAASSKVPEAVVAALKGKIDPTIWGSLQDYVDGKVAQWRYSKRGRKREVCATARRASKHQRGDELKRERAALQGAPVSERELKKVSPITTHPKRRQARRCIISGSDGARRHKPNRLSSGGGLNAAQSHRPFKEGTLQRNCKCLLPLITSNPCEQIFSRRGFYQRNCRYDPECRSH